MGTIQIAPAEDGRLIVNFGYSPERVAAIKAVSGRRYHPEGKYWTVPHTAEAVEQIQALFTNDRVAVSAAVRAASAKLSVERINEVMSALDEELTLRGYSPKTRDNYRLHIQRFLRWLRRDPATASEEELRAYLLEMLDDGLSASYVRQARAALVIVYEGLLDQSERVAELPSAKEKRRLPTVLSREEVERLLKATSGLMGRALLTVIYSAGLRVGEAIQLRASDILSERGQVRVRSGKGKKDRYTVLADEAVDVLRMYYRIHRPREWLFPGRELGSHISQRTARRIFNRAKEQARVNSKATIHTLRHSFATHMYEDGVDIRIIQELMGHARINTTLRYTHVAKPAAKQVRSPLDTLCGLDKG